MLRFTIRELLLLTVIVGMGLGWWAHVRQLKSQQRRLERDLLHQADLVSFFAGSVTQAGFELPADTGQYTKIIFPDYVQAHFRAQATSATVSVTTTVPRTELQRTLDGEFAQRYRAALSSAP